MAKQCPYEQQIAESERKRQRWLANQRVNKTLMEKVEALKSLTANVSTDLDIDFTNLPKTLVKQAPR